ncbi:hypothetical protein [Nocardioides sp. CER19]|uniref:hypothetical protein n=1 Tax=Nocardioides sp. CER19 TaxID=3038538 RepID=UPI00244A2811|nr:hypothetical protein [Nocardioides sp. CER19]MDH2416000.1 hypothetical protein [Nocardioides sp. CER19]
MSDDGIGMFHRHNAVAYWIAGGLVLVLIVIGLFAYRGAKENQAAQDKAGQLISLLQQKGVQRLPSQDQVARVLGDDGGAVCHDPAHALSKATLFSMITNGASGPGLRPVITDSRLLRGQLAVISVYCPDELDAVRKLVDDLKTRDVVRS